MRSSYTAGLALVLALAACLCLPSVTRATPAADPGERGPLTALRRQGRDSNCDFIAAANGVQAIGGNGDEAYARARMLIPQAAIDYREGFYTLLGPSGSDQPFSIDNLGAAPEAFIGVYEALGYDTLLLAAPPDQINYDFARAIRDQLAAAPATSFAHLWITPRAYTPYARTITLASTGEHAGMLYPYHEVAAVIDPQAADQLIVLDGLIGHPVAVALTDLAYQLRGFNKVLIVRRSGPSAEDHLAAQIRGSAQPYAVVGLGGAFLSTARQVWGAEYATWGRVIGPPLRMDNGAETVVRLPGEYVLYERGAGGVTFAHLGAWMRDSLVARRLLAPAQLRPSELRSGMRGWAEGHAGSLERFHALYGAPLTDEVWVSAETFRTAVLRGIDHPLAHAQASGYVIVLTERAMLAWSPEQGVTLVPLGQIYLRELSASLGL